MWLWKYFATRWKTQLFGSLEVDKMISDLVPNHLIEFELECFWLPTSPTIMIQMTSDQAAEATNTLPVDAALRDQVLLAYGETRDKIADLESWNEV